MDDVISPSARRTNTLPSKKLDGWRASPTVENADGAISDEYSDDDDPGYRIVLVEDVGELYPDVSYRMRTRASDPVPTPLIAKPEGSRNKEEGDEGDDEVDDDDPDEPEEDESGAAEDSVSEEDQKLAQRLDKIHSKADEETLTRLPVRSPVDQPDSPTHHPEVPSEPVLGWTETESPAKTESSGGVAKAEPPQAGAQGGAGDGKGEGAGSGDEEAEGEVVADAEALAAHHMADLVQAQAPMFSPGSASAAAPAAAAANAGATAATTKPAVDGEGEQVEAAEAPVAAVEPPAQGEGEAVAATAAASSEKEEAVAATDKAADPPDETVYYDCFDLKIVYERNRTGFEETKDFPIEINGIIAGRYQILEFLGAAAFSKAVQCVDLTDGSYVCIKIIKNNKDFFDQSLDEIKILKYLNAHDTRDDHHLLQLYDYFYFKEHLFIVTELLRDNLYEFSKFNRESGAENYFTLPRLQKITRECLEGLQFVHKLRLIHCDLKPENILIRSYSRCEIKIIDFGSSCFVTDHLTSYVQSRSYRAPEVILGLPYNELIDMWSLGCILAELWTGRVLFQNDSLATLLARVVGILGGIDEDMMVKGRYTHRFFTKHKILYDRLSDEDRSLVYIFPKRTSLQHRLACSDPLFIDFVGKLLEVNPSRRLSATKALEHPWLAVKY